MLWPFPELQDADSQAYSANFIGFSSAKGSAADFYQKAAQAIGRARARWLNILNMLELKP